MKPYYGSPPEILRILAEHVRIPEPEVCRLSPRDSGYLARGLDVSGSMRVTSINGYALPEGFAGGECGFRLRSLDALAAATPPPTSETTEGAPCPSTVVERVETGDAVPDACDRILPVHAARVTGSARLSVEFEARPPRGHGIEEPTALTLPIGTPLDARLVAFLLARGIQEVSTWPSLEIGVACVGSELVDSGAIAHVADGFESGRVADISGAWLDGAIQRLGHRTQALGTLDDEPDGILERLRRTARLGVHTVVLTGGLGDGFDDRMIETLQSAPFRIFFSGVQVAPGRRFLYAKGLGLDLFVLGGSPLDAAVAFDLFLAPCLLRMRGSDTWDWSAAGPVAAAVTDDRYVPVHDPEGEELWTASAIRHGLEHLPPPCDEDGTSLSLSKFRPGVAAQWGWWLRSPTDDAARRERFYRVPTRT